MICPTNSVGSYKYRLYGINKKSIKSINYTHSKTKENQYQTLTEKEQIYMEEMNLYIDEVLRFYYKKLAKLQKETRQIEKAIKVFEEMKRGDNDD